MSMSNYTTKQMKLPVDSLVFGSYQRSIKQAEVNKIVKSFDKRLMRPIDVSYRSGKYYVLDGQHRVAALKKLGVATVEATVKYGMTEQEEALFFVRNNDTATSSAATSMQTGLAKFIAGDAEAREIDREVHAAGLNIAYDGIKRVHSVAKYPPLIQAHKRGNLIQTLAIIDNAFDGAPSSFQSTLITNVSRLINSAIVQVDPDHLVKALNKLGIEAFLRTITRQQIMTAAQRTEAMKVVIADTYNKRLPESKKIPARW